jgi:hypothetical protein
MKLATGCVLLPGDMMLQREEMVMSEDKRGNIQLWPDHHQTLHSVLLFYTEEPGELFTVVFA